MSPAELEVVASLLDSAYDLTSTPLGYAPLLLAVAALVRREVVRAIHAGVRLPLTKAPVTLLLVVASFVIVGVRLAALAQG